MTITLKETFTCHFQNSDTEKQFPNKREAMAAARKYVENNAYTKPWPDEETYLFGPGDGSVSVVVSQDVSFADAPSEPAISTTYSA